MENPLKIALEQLHVSADNWEAISTYARYEEELVPYVNMLENGAHIVASTLDVDFYTALVMIIQTVLDRQELVEND